MHYYVHYVNIPLKYNIIIYRDTHFLFKILFYFYVYNSEFINPFIFYKIYYRQ